METASSFLNRNQLTCRLCAVQKPSGVEIFSGLGNDLDTLVESVYELLGHECKRNDTLPKWLCSDCQLEATATVRFVQLVRDGQLALQEQQPTPVASKGVSKKVRSKKNVKLLQDDVHVSTENDCGRTQRQRRVPVRFMDDARGSVSTARPKKKSLTICKNAEEDPLNAELIAKLSSPAGTCLANVFVMNEACAAPNTRMRIICQLCKGVFDREKMFWQHIKAHENDRKSAQSSTNENTADGWVATEVATSGLTTDPHSEGSSAQAERPNLDWQLNSAKFSCLKCSKTFENNFAVRRHYKEVHLAERHFKCDQCDVSFKNKSNYAYHMARHSGHCRFKCEKCTKSFILKYELKLHMRSHTKEKPFKCEKCKKSFGYRSNYVWHQRTHAEERSFRCDCCGLVSSSYAQFRRHKATHTKKEGGGSRLPVQRQESLLANSRNGPKSAQDQVKPKTMYAVGSSESLLKRNVEHAVATNATANGEGRDQAACLERPQILNVKILPPLVPPASGIDKPRVALQGTNRNANSAAAYRLQCHYCQKYFKQNSTLKRHLLTHTGEKPYKCSVCPKAFSDASNLRQHKILHRKATEQIQDYTAKLSTASYAHQMRRMLIEADTVDSLDDDAVVIIDPGNVEALVHRIESSNQTPAPSAVLPNNKSDDPASYLGDVDVLDVSNLLPYDISPMATTDLTMHESVRSQNQNQVVCVSYRDPTNPIDNKTTLIYLLK